MHSAAILRPVLFPADLLETGFTPSDEMDAYEPDAAVCETATVGDVHESIETNLFLAGAYAEQNALVLARECARAAYDEMMRYREIMQVYAGAEYCDRVRQTAVDMGVFRVALTFSH